MDEHLFNPDASQWLAIDAGNQAVPRVVVPTLADGLALVGRGRVAALVGHLRDGVGVVDIDVPGPLGDFLAAEVADWLCRRGCWVLERPSGGARGRSHIFFARPDFRYASAAARSGLAADVSAFLGALAVDVKVPRHELDLRDAVRPLSSPHRHGPVTAPKGDLREALRALKRVLPDRPTPSQLRPRTKARAFPSGQHIGQGIRPSTESSGSAALVIPLALHRWQRQLRAEWRHYLLRGQVPPGSWAAGSTRTRDAVAVDRSLVEAACTRELVWAVGNPETAWRIIREAHPTAMTKAKHQGYSWWIAYVWNASVRSAETLTTKLTTTVIEPRATAPPDHVVDGVIAARQDLERLKWTVPARQRATLLMVGHQLLDRALRARDLRFPCPERDLQLDCGLGDRKTIRAALARLNGQIGTLHTDCLSPVNRDCTSYEFEINPAPNGGVRQSPPPVFDPPPAPRGLWRALPRSSHSLWRALLTASTPLDLDELVVKAGLVESCSDQPSKSQRSTGRAALVALGKAGMARADENGRWQVASRPCAVQLEQEAAAGYARQWETIEAERVAYRAGTTSSWVVGRARAIKLAKSREKAWWTSLDRSERVARVTSKRFEFDQMSITDQASLKARLAERRIQAGMNELETYLTWLNSLSGDEYVARSLDRKQRFERLSPGERGASVAAWERHRQRYGLAAQPAATAPRFEASGVEHQALLPDGPGSRDNAFLERQGQLPTGELLTRRAGLSA